MRERQRGRERERETEREAESETERDRERQRGTDRESDEKNDEKCFLFHTERTFCSQVIQIVFFLSFCACIKNNWIRKIRLSQNL